MSNSKRVIMVRGELPCGDRPEKIGCKTCGMEFDTEDCPFGGSMTCPHCGIEHDFLFELDEDWTPPQYDGEGDPRPACWY